MPYRQGDRTSFLTGSHIGAVLCHQGGPFCFRGRAPICDPLMVHYLLRPFHGERSARQHHEKPGLAGLSVAYLVTPRC